TSMASAADLSTVPRRPRQKPSAESSSAATPTAAMASQGRRGENWMVMSLAQPFEEGRNMDLVGLVVAGQHVHHDVDPGAEGIVGPDPVRRPRREHGRPVGTDRPGTGEVVAGYHDRRDAVAGACRPVRVLATV